MQIRLIRFSYSPTETEGFLEVAGFRFATIEKPWRENKKAASCIPEGRYEVYPHTRPSGEKVYRLANPALGIYPREVDIPSGKTGRSEILIHSANFERQLQGCIAPGMARGLMKDPETGQWARAVVSSRLALEEIREILGRDGHELVVEQVKGAV